jgi:predicted RNase H-like nuclease
MAGRRSCKACGNRNTRRAWDCAMCGRMTSHAKRQAIRVVLMLGMAGSGYLYVQSVVRSALPG